ncbi:hypothetical protein B5V01_05945 [Mesorhizobium erdmanii]|uniref:Uncharacterized protein n=2 Tax=Mesorhizobium TaxID=68287 RepID=A0A3M9X940_9HYPH|nr:MULTISPECIES: hypothetical protein [Mesorhizobium]RNJ44425.1 hypothetical protein DNR46_17455 [Mesorhizobium japonicum]RXT49436.1 hypothetical protein B5V01_05945 [Mesorhizobium erdmanii]
MTPKQDKAAPPPDGWEFAADEAIAAHGGDARAAVQALLAANASLEREVALWAPAVSYGFSRGWHKRQRGGTD